MKNETDGTISLAKTVTYKLDKTAPTGKVEFVNRNAWEEFVNTITFGLFFKDEVTVKATANDTLSGVDKIEYASADKAMTLDEVKAITDWTEYTDSFGVTLEDAKTFVYFVRITDKAGNVGIRRVEEECPALLDEGAGMRALPPVDIKRLDAEVRKYFSSYHACDLNIAEGKADEPLSTNTHHKMTEMIARSVLQNSRDKQEAKEAYLDCLDSLFENKDSLLIRGSLFSGFSMYFLRYLSILVARGDNIAFVCNSEAQIESVYEHLMEGFSRISSLYCEDYRSDKGGMDDPIWKIIKISGEHDDLREAAVDEKSILVTSLGYLCSDDFEGEHARFIHLLGTVVFVDTAETANAYGRQLSILNTRLRHITKENARRAQNASLNKDFCTRYMSEQVRYICFDDTRMQGLENALNNMLAVDMHVIDAMHYSTGALVRCYHYEVYSKA